MEKEKNTNREIRFGDGRRREENVSTDKA